MKTLYIVDANVAVKWFVPEIHQTAALRLRQSDNELHVPEFFLLEFGNVVCKKWRRGEVETSNIPLPLHIALQRRSHLPPPHASGVQ